MSIRITPFKYLPETTMEMHAMAQMCDLNQTASVAMSSLGPIIREFIALRLRLIDAEVRIADLEARIGKLEMMVSRVLG